MQLTFLKGILKVVFLGSLLAISGCQKRAPLVAALPPPPPPLAPAPEVVAMEDATRAFQASDYARAIVCYEDYLRFAPAGNQRDHALLQPWTPTTTRVQAS